MEKEKMNEKKQKQRGFKQGVELIYKYRFVLSFLLLIMLVSFKISGSSMGTKFTSGVALPETGGPGTTLLYLLSALLLAAPLTIILIKRRRTEKKEH